ncbi:MAG: sensor histidine kinase [Rhodobacteraceae bacterium]|nr:sensor histidine kinase [Paracoccaceae bacterium]
MSETAPKTKARLSAGLIPTMVGISLIVAVLVIWGSYGYFTQSFTENLRTQAQTRAALYAGNIKSTLQKHSVVPFLLARDLTLSAALQSESYAATSQRLIEVSEEIGSASVFLLDITGRVVASSDRRQISKFFGSEPYFINALRNSSTVFSTTSNEQNTYRFFFSQNLKSGPKSIGVIVVEVDLRQQEVLWRRLELLVALVNSQGEIQLSSELNWRRQSIQDLIEVEPVSASRRVLDALQQTRLNDFVFINGERLFAAESPVDFRGWHISYFASTQNVAARVNAILALEIMGMAIAAALLFFYLSRRRARESERLSAESTELRALNTRLSAEMAQRQRAERNLQSAEQNLEQSSKLAALGQMSAAVSHELNQPLAAMRTYLAGAKLLVARNRLDEAKSSFQRIDDLIARMTVITKQLKSYARKSSESAVEIDLRDCVASAMAMMAPQLGKETVRIVQNMPDSKVCTLGDNIRVEQIIINLLRNALDALKDIPEPRIEISLEAGETARLSVLDNGPGFEDPEALFEPFYTTKAPGEGVGLGLAISAGIATEMGGRLMAQNATPLGALFTLELPLAQTKNEAAA